MNPNETIFSTYKIITSPSKNIIKVIPYYGLLETFGLFFTVWICTLIPLGIWYLLHGQYFVVWHVPAILSLIVTFILIKKFAWNFWGVILFVFEKEGVYIFGDTAPVRLHYSEIKTLEIHKIDNNDLYRIQFIMQSGDIGAQTMPSASREVLEELAKIIISQDLSKNLAEKKVSNNKWRKFYDNLYSTRLNRKNYMIGMIINELLLIDIFLLAVIYGRANQSNPVLAYTIFIVVVLNMLFYYSLVARRQHDIGFITNDSAKDPYLGSYMLVPQPIYAYGRFGNLLWITIKLFFEKSATFENQFGKPPEQHLDLRKVFGLR